MTDATPHRATAEQWAQITTHSTEPMFVVASCVEELRARVEALEAMRETEKAAVLDLYQQYDKLKEWVGKNYLRIRALESALLPDLGPIQGH